jgi:hypothetical protein
MFDAIKAKFAGRPKITRQQILAARPVRNASLKWERELPKGAVENAPEVVLLQVPRRRDRLGDFFAKIFRLPDFRKVELDEIGSEVWERCDGNHNVEAITKAISERYNLNRRQSETSVTAYLRMLAERRFIALKSGTGKAAAKTGERKVASGNAVRKRKQA